MTEIELLACLHLDRCIEAGEFKESTVLAIRKLFSMIKQRDQRILDLAEAAHQFVQITQESRELSEQSHALEQQKGKMPVFIACYVQAYQKRYGDKCRPDLGGKAQGVMKTILKDLSLMRACQLIQVYLQMDVKWFITKAHDIVTFKENLNVIGNALDTGQNPGGVDWSKFDWGIKD